VAQARISTVDTAARSATIHLPRLRVVSTRVDHEKTKVWSVDKTTWLSRKRGDQRLLCDTAMYHAQQLIESAATSERNLSQAKAQAELLIRQMYDLVDWTVTVEWE
jgi:hypothetical protein